MLLRAMYVDLIVPCTLMMPVRLAQTLQLLTRCGVLVSVCSSPICLSGLLIAHSQATGKHFGWPTLQACLFMLLSEGCLGADREGYKHGSQKHLVADFLLLRFWYEMSALPPALKTRREGKPVI